MCFATYVYLSLSVERKVAESESKIANLEEEVQDIKKSAKHQGQNVPNLESMLKDIKTSLVLNGGGIFLIALESYLRLKLINFGNQDKY